MLMLVLVASYMVPAVIFIWVFSASLLVWFILKMTMGIRVTEEEEYNGMDASDCGVDAYPEFVSVKSAG